MTIIYHYLTYQRFLFCIQNKLAGLIQPDLDSETKVKFFRNNFFKLNYWPKLNNCRIIIEINPIQSQKSQIFKKITWPQNPIPFSESKKS